MKQNDHLNYRWPRLIKKPGITVSIIILLLGAFTCVAQGADAEVSVHQVLARVQMHEFHPLGDDSAFTEDRDLSQHGIVDLADNDWKVRLLAVRNLVLLGSDHVDEIAEGLAHYDEHVRQICAMALGVLRAQAAIGNLEAVVRDDAVAMVR